MYYICVCIYAYFYGHIRIKSYCIISMYGTFRMILVNGWHELLVDTNDQWSEHKMLALDESS